MQIVNPEHRKAVIHAINESPFFRHMSMKVTEFGEGYSVVSARIRQEHMNPFGAIHGGVYASLIDTAAYWSAYCELPEDLGLITIDLKVDLLASGIEGNILVKGQRIKSGKTIYLTEAKMFHEDGRLLGHGTSKLLVTPNRQSIQDVVACIGLDKLPSKFIIN